MRIALRAVEKIANNYLRFLLPFLSPSSLMIDKELKNRPEPLATPDPPLFFFPPSSPHLFQRWYKNEEGKIGEGGARRGV